MATTKTLLPMINSAAELCRSASVAVVGRARTRESPLAAANLCVAGAAADKDDDDDDDANQSARSDRSNSFRRPLFGPFARLRARPPKWDRSE